MAAKKQTTPPVEIFPLLKTVEQMSKISGIGEHKLRELMDTGEIEFVQNGNTTRNNKNGRYFGLILLTIKANG